MVGRKFKNIRLKKLKTFYSKDGNVIRVFRRNYKDLSENLDINDYT